MITTTMMITRLLLLTRLPPWRLIPEGAASLEEPEEQQQDQEYQKNDYKYRYEPTPHVLTSLAKNLSLTNERQYEHDQKDHRQQQWRVPYLSSLTSLPVSRWSAMAAIYTFSDPDETGMVTKKRRPLRDAAGRSSSGEHLTSFRPFRRRAWLAPPPRARPR